MKPLCATKEAYQLFHAGTLALARVEANGIQIDVPYLHRVIKETEQKQKDLEQELRNDKVVYKAWRRRYGDKLKLAASEQLAEVVFNDLGYPSAGYTEKSLEEDAKKKRLRSDEPAFAHVDLPFIQTYFRWRKLEKVSGTYLKGILREVCPDGLLHPSFNLNTAITYRSCIARGTMIEVVRDVSKYPKGIPIEKVRPGDYVYCYDDSLNLTVRRVLWAGKTGRRKVVRLHWSARGKHGHLDLTPEHMVRVASGQYVRADCLVAGDYRMPTDSHHKPRRGVLAMGRIGGHLYQTGRVKAIHDHRLVYESLIGPLTANEVVHHKDHNHLNNVLGNLEKHTLSSHARLHAPTSLTPAARAKGVRIRNERLAAGLIVLKTGMEHHSWINLTKYQFLRMLSKAGGRLTKAPYDFGCLKRKAAMLGIDLKAVKDRFDCRGIYISRGLLQAIPFKEAQQRFGYYRSRRLYAQYNIPFRRKWRNQFGEFVPGNHKITKVEHLDVEVDVYDIEVDGCHNFIANEICVHNSSAAPNFQNLPIRDEEQGAIIRQAFIARPGRLLGEGDFKGVEVRVACAVTKDPQLIKEFTGPDGDPHGDTARQLFLLEKAQVDKRTTRDWAKNRFVFPQFYGDVYFQCAPHLWEAVEARGEDGSYLHKLPGTDVSVREHLRRQGIRELGACNPKQAPARGTFEYLVKEAEYDFWYNRFHVYTAWKKRHWRNFLANGEFITVTGFRIGPYGKEGLLERNGALNYPIQGPAFHCLLWTLIQFQKWLDKYRMRTLIVGQIHDSCLFDSPPDELDDCVAALEHIIGVQLPKHWPWITVPMAAEFEVCPMGGNWHGKRPYKAG